MLKHSKEKQANNNSSIKAHNNLDREELYSIKKHPPPPNYANVIKYYEHSM